MNKERKHTTHPLQRGGLSRPERTNPALSAASAPVDGRNLGDLLRFWYDFARQVNYYGLEEGAKAPSVQGDWLDFFRRSVPFQYATIGAFDLDELDERFQEINKSIENRRTFAALSPMLDLILEMAQRLVQWRDDLTEDTTGLKATIDGLIETNLQDWARQLIGLANAGAKWGYRPPMAISSLWKAYDLPSLQYFGVDRSIISRRGSLKNKVLAGRDVLEKIYRVFWKALEAVVLAARDDDHLEEALKLPEKADTPPHLGLVFSFLLLFREMQGNLNGLTEKHLDFFYRKTLQLKTLPAQNDHAYLIFELGKQVEESLLVEKGLRFKAGKDEAGAEMIFTLDEDIVVTKSQVAELRTLYITDPNEDEGNIYATTIANSGDGLGGKFPKNTPEAWPTVGSETAVYADLESEVPVELPKVETGFMLASPALLLREGVRTITLTITLQADCLFAGDEVFVTNEVARSALSQALSIPLPEITVGESGEDTSLSIKESQAFRPFFSTKDGWLGPVQAPEKVRFSVDASTKQLELEITQELAVDFPAIVNPGGVLPEEVPGNLPAVKIELNSELKNRHRWHCLLGGMSVKKSEIKVKVCGVRQLVLQNDLAVLDPGKPFMPFGPAPKKNSSNFYIGSEEVFVKDWSKIDLELKWKDLPESLSDHYAGYPDPAMHPTELEVKVDVDCLKDKAWQPIQTAETILQTTPNTNGNVGCDVNPDTVLISLKTAEGIAACNYSLDLLEGLGTETLCGYLRLTLGDRDFMHDRYNQALINHATTNLAEGNQALQSAAEDVKEKVDELIEDLSQLDCEAEESLEAIQSMIDKVNLVDTEVDNFYTNIQSPPNPPYTPTLESISLNYCAKDESGEGLHFGYLHPGEGRYSWCWQQTEADAKPPALLPTLATSVVKESFSFFQPITDEGQLFIGLDQLAPGELVNLYFELDPATADPQLDKATVNWSYLVGNEWKELRPEIDVLSDTTEGLIQPGIVKIALPTNISRFGTSILPSEYHWLRASVPSRSKAIAAAIRVSAQAASVTFTPDSKNDLQRLSDPLAAESIAKIADPVNGVKSVLQPVASFGGRAPEAADNYHRRVSELLRHKGRAVTLNDYERLVLEAFPQVYRVKCLTHTLGVRGKVQHDVELAPGKVTIVVVPDLTQLNAVNPFEPRLPAADLEAIRKYLQERVSPFVEVTVLNPAYEPIRLQLKVKFKAGKSVDFFQRQLQKDLRLLLAPWTWEEAGPDISFGGQFLYSTAVHYVEELNYVDYVEELRIINPDDSLVTQQQASNARSILTTINGEEAAKNRHIIIPIES